jgi:hypothetical protein
MLDKKVATGGKKMPASRMTTSPRQIETSMSKKYKGTPKVAQSTIDSIKKMGMTASLKKAATSKNPMYLEGIRRMYGASRLAAAKKATASPAGRMSPRVAERAVKKSAPAAKSTTKTVYNPRTGQPVTYTEPAKKAAAKPKVTTPSKATKSPYTRGSSNAPGGR